LENIQINPLHTSLNILPENLIEGENQIVIEIVSDYNGKLPYNVRIDYKQTSPPSAKEEIIKFTLSLSRKSYTEDESGTIRFRIKNVSPRNTGMVIARVGMPGGLVPYSLDNLMRENKFSFWKSSLDAGGYIDIYFDDLESGGERTFDIDFGSNIGGTFTGPASYAYRMYEPDSKWFVEPLVTTIVPAASDVPTTRLAAADEEEKSKPPAPTAPKEIDLFFSEETAPGDKYEGYIGEVRTMEKLKEIIGDTVGKPKDDIVKLYKVTGGQKVIVANNKNVEKLVDKDEIMVSFKS